MPKDPSRNQPNYKIGGYHINEFEFEKGKGQMTQQEEKRPRPKKEMTTEPDSENEFMNDQDVSSGGRSDSTP
jgi:hypothetical protein